MSFAKYLIGVEIDFAKRVSEIKNEKLDDVLIDYTSFYKLVGLPGWNYDPENVVWAEFVKGFGVAENKVEYVYSQYLKHVKDLAPKSKFGCFSYDYVQDENYIQIHFNNSHSSDSSPLAEGQIENRKKEIKEMFTEIKRLYPNVDTVCGFSWLYNSRSYRRLFPPEYTKNPKEISNWFKALALWGQFITHKNEVKYDLTDRFRDCIKTKNTLEEVCNCFPFKILEMETNIENFYHFYGV